MTTVRSRLAFAYRLLAPQRAHIAGLLAATAAASALVAVPPLLTRAVVDGAVARHDRHLLLVLVSAMIATAAGYAVLAYAQNMSNAVLAQRLSRALRAQLVARIYRVPLSALSGTLGDLMTRVSSDVDGLEGAWSGTLVTAFSNVTVLAVSIGLVFALSVPLGILALVLLPLPLLASRRLAPRTYALRRANRAARDAFATLLAETLTPTGIAFVKSYVLHEPERKRIDRITAGLQSTELRATEIGVRFAAWSALCTMATPALIWLVGALLLDQGIVTLGTLVAVGALVMRLFTPLLALASLQLQLAGTAVLLDRVREYLEIPGEPESPPLMGSRPPARVHGELVFEAVAFAYPRAAAPVLHAVSFRVAAGECVAIAGSSGIGKSTLVGLIPRLLEPTRGRILLDGTDLREYELDALRGQVGVVSQEGFFLNDSIRANLLLGKPGADDAELARACELARAWSFVAALPGGLDTPVGDRGTRLSGGQRQRLALARLFLKDPAIVILDEATSALDARTETELFEQLARTFAGRTRIVVAHSASALAHADRIVRIESGTLLETTAATGV